MENVVYYVDNLKFPADNNLAMRESRQVGVTLEALGQFVTSDPV
jgi:hypothetical protein